MKIKAAAERSDLNVLVYAADLRSEDSVKELWAKAKAVIGKIDVLINNAGTMNYSPIGSIEPDLWWNDFVSFITTTQPSIYIDKDVTEEIYKHTAMS